MALISMVVERGVVEAIVIIGTLLFAASLYSAYSWGLIHGQEGK